MCFYPHPSTKSSRVSLRTIPLRVCNPKNGREEVVNALLDDGCSAVTAVSSQLAGRLALEGRRVENVTEGVGGILLKNQVLLTQVRIRPLAGAGGKLLPVQVMPRPAGSYVPVNWQKQAPQFPHLQGIAFPPPVEGGVDVLLGNRWPHFLRSLEEVAGAEG